MSSAASTLAKRSTNVWKPRRFRVTNEVVDNRPEPKKRKSILKHTPPLVPCDPAWLPETDEPLEPLEPIVPKKQVWFPEDNVGEPHPQNPDDGCGGAKYKLSDTQFYDAATTSEMREANYNETCNFYREALDIFNKTTGTPPIHIWSVFQSKTDALKEPCYSLIGSMWRILFRGAPRLEERFL